MPDVILGLLAAALPALATIWASGRQYRERRVLKEEMDLHKAWASEPRASALAQHIDRQLETYLDKASFRQHSLSELARRLIALVVATWLAVLGLATAAGVLEPSEFLRDPDSWLLAVLGGAFASGSWTVYVWSRSRRAWTQRQKGQPPNAQPRKDAAARAGGIG